MFWDGYRLLGQLGAGRDGVAYLAEARDGGGKTFVLTRLDPARADPARWPLLLVRLRLAARLRHPASRQLLEFGPDEVPPYVLSALDDRTPLAASTRPLSPHDASAITLRLAAALTEAHRLGLAHGRLGPETVRGDDPRAVSIDFLGLDDGTGPPSSLDHPIATPEGDVADLGALLARLVSTALDDDPVLGPLVAEMRSSDPFARPSAAEVAARLTDHLESSDADWPGLDPDRPQNDATALWATPSSAILTAEICDSSEQDDGFVLQDVRLSGGASSPGMPSAGLAPERLGRYRIAEKLGEGGMGAVYRAVDEADGAVVAVKILKPEWAERPNALKRFRKEARLLARVRNPCVTNLLDVNEDQGVHYLVLEFVAGKTLDRALTKGGRLDERTALAVAADVARGLAEAHRLGIVHRDVKPSNILVVGDVLRRDDQGDVPRVKLSDFGLARHAFEEGSQVVTQSGVIVGTPSYMAPEQCAGESIDARTDVYSLGATMYHLVAGRPPFEGADWRAVVAQHLNAPLPPLRTYNPTLSDGFCRVVERALAKLPASRYGDAEALLADLERLLRGEPTGLPMHPALPDAAPGKSLAFDFTWELDAPPRALWPHVSNTDRLDRALGFTGVKYTLRFDPERGVRRFLEGRKAGMEETGEEHPYEWVEGRRLGVFREYEKGPFRWVVSVVELAPTRRGGTTLTHRLRFEPRGRLVRLGSRWGVGSRMRQDLGRIYRRIDAAVGGKLGRGPAADPFEPVPEPSDELRTTLDAMTARLVDRGVRVEVAEALVAFVGEAPEPLLARIRPIALARRLGLPEDEVVAAFLQGASVGLLVMLWDLLCPACREPSEVKETLEALDEHGHCEACCLDYALDFANSVELIFRAHPSIRPADTATYCAAGPSHSPHVVAQVRLAAGERLELDLSLSDGLYRLRGPQLGWSLDLQVRPEATARRWDHALARGPIDAGPVSLASGQQVLDLTNDSCRPLVVRVERVAPRDDALTAARATTLATFRALFPAELLAPGRLVTVANVTILLAALPSDLYESLGDPGAFDALLALQEAVRLAAGREGGAILKAIDSGVVAVFDEPSAALRAALGISSSLIPGDASLRIALHRGPVLAATIDSRLDYFGATALDASQALLQSPANHLVLTDRFASEPSVAALINSLGLIPAVLESDRDPASFCPLLVLGLRAGPPRRDVGRLVGPPAPPFAIVASGP